MVKPTRTPPDDQTLLDWSGEHLAHELFMFQQSVETLYSNQYRQEIHTFEKQVKRGIPSARERYHRAILLHNSLIESFTIHFRNLYDFFYGSLPTREEFYKDARASDFYDDPLEWSKARPVKDDIWESTKNG